MTYTAEQRAIIDRLDELAARVDATRSPARSPDLTTAAYAVIDRFAELRSLAREQSKLFREFLATL